MTTPTPNLGPDYDSPYDPVRHPVLRGRAGSIMRAIIVTIAPQNERINIRLDDEVYNFAENFVSYLPTLMRRAFPFGLWLLELVAFFEGGEWRTFSRMQDRKKQFAYLQRWNQSNFALRRELMKGIRAIVMCGFYSHEKVWELIGYHPRPWVAQMIKQREEHYGTELERPAV